jgi:hypothetical protein
MDDIDSAANRRYEGDVGGGAERRRSIGFCVGVFVDI